MPRKTTHVPLHALLSGLLLAACGGVPEAGLAPAEESLGTAEAAMCSGMSVTSLTLAGISTYQGEMAGNGGWAVSPGANAVRLEYYIDGTLRGSEERRGTYNPNTNSYEGNWYFSAANIACGPRGFVVRAVPMIIDSMGNRTTCSDSPRSISQTVTEPCPTPEVNLHFCYRYPDPYTSSTVRCDASASGGSGTYNVLWKKSTTSSWAQGQWTQFFDCANPSNPPPYNSYISQTQFQVKVIDSAGKESTIKTSSTFSCEIRW